MQEREIGADEAVGLGGPEREVDAPDGRRGEEALVVGGFHGVGRLQRSGAPWHDRRRRGCAKLCAMTVNRRDFIKNHKAGAVHSAIGVFTIDAGYVALAAGGGCCRRRPKAPGELIRVERGYSRPSVAPSTVGVLASG